MSNEELRNRTISVLLHSSFFIRNSSFSLFLALILTACAASTPAPPPVQPPPPPPPRLTTAHAAQRVILVSFDGLSADRAVSSPAFQRLTAHATRVVPVNPTVTSSTHAAMLTGLTPEKTVIVSKQLSKPGKPHVQYTSGLASDISQEKLST